MNLLSSLIYCIKHGLEHPSQIGRRAVGLSRACSALSLEEAALPGGAMEVLTSRREEWRSKSTLCRAKDISKHPYVLAQPVLMPILTGLECRHSKSSSTARISPYSKSPCCKVTSFYSLSRERDHVHGMAPGKMRDSGEQFDGNIWEEYDSEHLWHCYENESYREVTSPSNIFLDADFDTVYVQLYTHPDIESLSTETACTMPNLTKISFATKTHFVPTIKQIRTFSWPTNAGQGLA